MSTAHDMQELFTRARRIAFGTAASFVEILQDTNKRNQNFKQFSENFNQLADEMAVKGEETEMEARRQMDSWWSSTAANRTSNSVPTKIEVVDITDESDSVSGNGSAEVTALTAEIATLKAELEQLRSSQNGTSENDSPN
ncbi:MAG: hypothetical protein AAF268_02075 [Cyanobacteria bacterium P01_A01_bin.3]